MTSKKSDVLPEEFYDDWPDSVKTLWFERSIMRLIFYSELDSDFNRHYNKMTKLPSVPPPVYHITKSMSVVGGGASICESSSSGGLEAFHTMVASSSSTTEKRCSQEDIPHFIDEHDKNH